MYKPLYGRQIIRARNTYIGMSALLCVHTEYLRQRYHSVLFSRLAFSAFILLLDREPQLRTPMAVITASFSSASSECLSNRLFKTAIAFWYSIIYCLPLVKLIVNVFLIVL